MSLFRSVIALVSRTWSPQVNTVRYRYHADKIKKGPLVRRMGYNELIDHRGTLAHIASEKRIRQMKVYRPSDAWTQKKALFGQNDYIDILGNERMKPSNILYNVPYWLRGVSGNEFQVLLRKRKMLKNGSTRYLNPTKWKHMQQRITYLYKFLNRKTKTAFSTQ